MQFNHDAYEVHSYIDCIDSYLTLENPSEWVECCRCGLKPRIWLFDNGHSTACGCWNNTYDSWSIRAESIASLIKRGAALEWDPDDLRKNWNYYNATGELLFAPALGRW
jgi:hypothetical protein